MRIAKRHATPEDDLPGNVRARAVQRVIPETGEVYGLVLYKGYLGSLEALHEVIHCLNGDITKPGTTHHPAWHFCAQVGREAFRLGPWHSTFEQRLAARRLLAAKDGQFIDTNKPHSTPRE